MIEGLKMIDEYAKVNTANPVDLPANMTDMIRLYHDLMDRMIDRLSVSARVLVGETMRVSPGEIPSPGCLMDDVKLLGEKMKRLTELCDIIGGCL